MTLYEHEAVFVRESGRTDLAAALRERRERSLAVHAGLGGVVDDVLVVRTVTPYEDELSVRVESVLPDGRRAATSTSHVAAHSYVAHGAPGSAAMRERYETVVVHGGLPRTDWAADHEPASSSAIRGLAAARGAVDHEPLAAALASVTRGRSIEGVAHFVASDYAHGSLAEVLLATTLLTDLASGAPLEWLVRRVGKSDS